MSFVVAMVCMVPHLHAQRITMFRADVDLRKDGSAVVTEKVTITGTTSLERSLPLLLKIGNNQWLMEINVLSVRDTSGNPLRYQALIRDRHLEIRVPLLTTAPFDQPQTVLLTYEVRHGVVVFMETSFYSFDLTLRDDHEPPVPIDEVLVTVTVPADPQGGLSAYMFRGAEKPQITVEGRTVSLSERNVPAGHWVGFAVSFPGRMVSLPMGDWFHQEASLYLAGMVFMLALIGILFFYRRSTSGTPDLGVL
jgi:hypothetical protein